MTTYNVIAKDNVNFASCDTYLIVPAKGGKFDLINPKLSWNAINCAPTTKKALVEMLNSSYAFVEVTKA